MLAQKPECITLFHRQVGRAHGAMWKVGRALRLVKGFHVGPMGLCGTDGGLEGPLQPAPSIPRSTPRNAKCCMMKIWRGQVSN